MDKLLNFSGGAATATATEEIDRTGKIHLRTQQFGRKWITTIEGLDDDLDLKRIARALKRTLNVSVSVHDGDDGGQYIKLQGNQRETVPQWLVTNEVITEKEARERLIVHGI